MGSVKSQSLSGHSTMNRVPEPEHLHRLVTSLRSLPIIFALVNERTAALRAEVDALETQASEPLTTVTQAYEAGVRHALAEDPDFAEQLIADWVQTHSSGRSCTHPERTAGGGQAAGGAPAGAQAEG